MLVLSQDVLPLYDMAGRCFRHQLLLGCQSALPEYEN